MRLDHVSYVTSHDQLADTIQRLGSRIGTTFVDGGIHPRFGTRNFTAPLLGGQYIEVVCPLDHPAAEQTPWGKAVSRKAAEGGGWLTWVFSVEDIDIVEKSFARKAVAGHRTRPDGSDLKWKQIGVKEIAEAPQLPFFIQWLTTEHPSQNGTGIARIKSICISDTHQLKESWFKDEILSALSHNSIEIEWAKPDSIEEQEGIIAIDIYAPTGIVRLD